jgi:four helix bundle protein
MNKSLPERSKAFALRVIRVYTRLAKGELARILGRQVLRAGTSVGAHCREAFRARSDAELISKLEVAAQELDETIYWLELLADAEVVRRPLLGPLKKEADEIMAIVVSSILTVKRRRR